MKTLLLSIKLLFILAFMGSVGLVIYALLSDLPIPEQSVVIELPLPPEQ